ncbi:MAG TPA: hypothetical protein VNG95_00570 [Gemmatimonadales bacterium]|nr:hypothetical protein [Gemmatimonadales bacterium]
MALGSLGAQAAPRPAGDAVSDRAFRRAIGAARDRFDAAVAVRDPHAIAALFASDAVITFRADTIRGRDAIDRFLVTALGDASWLEVYAAPERTERCLTGMDETGGQYTAIRTVPTASDTLRGRYALRWVLVDDSTALIGALTTSVAFVGPAPSIANCGSRESVRYAARRVFIGVPTPIATGAWSTFGSLTAALQGRGYRDGDLLGLTPAAGYGASFENATPLIASVRVRVTPRWSLEAFASLGTKQAHLTGYRASDSSYLRADYRGAFGGVVAAYAWHGVRVGAGPVLLANSWTLQESHVDLDTGGTFHPGAAVGAASWHERPIGIVALVAWTFPVSSVVYIEARAQVLRLPAQSTRPTPGFPAARVANHSDDLSLGIGIAL